MPTRTFTLLTEETLQADCFVEDGSITFRPLSLPFDAGGEEMLVLVWYRSRGLVLLRWPFLEEAGCIPFPQSLYEGRWYIGSYAEGRWKIESTRVPGACSTPPGVP